MNYKTALRAHLVADAGVSAIADDVYWVIRPQNTDLPAVVLTTVSSVRHRDLEGANGFWDSRVQFSCYAYKQSEVEALKAAVIAACEGSFTQSGITMTLQGEPQSYDRGQDIGTAFVHHSLTEMRFHHNG